MEYVEIVDVKRSEIEQIYRNMGKKILSDDIFKHLSFEIGLFNRKNVEMNYLHLIKDNVEIGCGILVYKDKRKKFEFFYEKQLLKNPNSCLLKNCYIDKHFRGFGYFKLMLANFEHKAISRNLNKMLLAINENNLKSIAIFKHLGFSITKSVHSNDSSFVIMEKKLF